MRKFLIIFTMTILSSNSEKLSEILEVEPILLPFSDAIEEELKSRGYTVVSQIFKTGYSGYTFSAFKGNDETQKFIVRIIDNKPQKTDRKSYSRCSSYEIQKNLAKDISSIVMPVENIKLSASGICGPEEKKIKEICVSTPSESLKKMEEITNDIFLTDDEKKDDEEDDEEEDVDTRVSKEHRSDEMCVSILPAPLQTMEKTIEDDFLNEDKSINTEILIQVLNDIVKANFKINKNNYLLRNFSLKAVMLFAGKENQLIARISDFEEVLQFDADLGSSNEASYEEKLDVFVNDEYRNAFVFVHEALSKNFEIGVTDSDIIPIFESLNAFYTKLNKRNLEDEILI
jgi:hypothetical protein